VRNLRVPGQIKIPFTLLPIVGSAFLVFCPTSWGAQLAALKGCSRSELAVSAGDKNIAGAFEQVPVADRVLVCDKLTNLLQGLSLDSAPDVVFNAFGNIDVGTSCEGRVTLYIGPDVFRYFRTTSKHALDLVLAHELAHFLQFKASGDLVKRACINKLGNIKLIELLADTVAGYSMRKLFNSTSHNDLIVVISTLSEYNVYQEDHHGTVNERVNAFNLGQLIAASGRILDVSRLMKNQDAFTQILGGPAYGASAAEIQNYYEQALKRLYQ